MVRTTYKHAGTQPVDELDPNGTTLDGVMELRRSGIIPCAKSYETCVDYYRRILELPELLSLDIKHSRLTCLDIAGSYLMIETGGSAVPCGPAIPIVADGRNS